jgi:hypothetical protein
MLAAIDVAAIDDGAEVAPETRRQARFGDTMDQRIVPQTILDQLGDGRDLEVVGRGESLDVGKPRH